MPLGSWTVDRLAAVALAVAAGLLLSIAYLARRIADQAAEIEKSLEHSHEATKAIFDVPRINGSLEQLTKRLAQQRSDGQS